MESKAISHRPPSSSEAIVKQSDRQAIYSRSAVYALLHMLCAVLFALCLLSSPTWAATYYVDAPNGNDINAGTSESAPWKTISKVNTSNFQPGDFILFKRGEMWREQLTVPSSGTADAPITFGAYGSGDKPIITAADVVATWGNVSGNLWSASLSTEPNQVFFDNVKGNRQTSIDNVDSANDWYWESKVLYVYSTSDPDTTYTNPGIETSIRDHAIWALQKLYITIDGIEAIGAHEPGVIAFAYNWQPIYGIIVQNCKASRNDHRTSGAGICFFGPDFHNSQAINNECFDNYNSGILLGCNVSTYTNSSNITISGNYVHDNGFFDLTSPFEPHGRGIYIENVDSSTFQGNKLVNNNGCAIKIHRGTDNNTFAYNLIEQTIDSVKGGFDIVTSDAYLPTGNKIYNNTIFMQYGGWLTSQAWGINIYCQADDTEIKNNIFYTIAQCIYINSDQSTFDEWNIVFTNNSYCRSDSSYPMRFVTGGYITFATWQGYGYDANSMESDPLFTDASTDNFTLQTTSPCIDAGTDVSPTQDFNGTAVPQGDSVDIGAFEYKTIPAPPKN